MNIIIFMFVIGIILITAMLIYSILIGDDEDSIEFKTYMCVTSKRRQICDGNCKSCAWYIGPDETSDGRESTKGE
jgi:hypothetical protein